MNSSDVMIVVILDECPRLRFISKNLASFDVPGGGHFEDTGLGGHNHHNGFYDFLRSRKGSIIGIRYIPDFEPQVLLSALRESRDLRIVMRSGQLEHLLIFCGKDHDFDAQLSQDQCFGENMLYLEKTSRRLAASFGIDLLSDAERDSLKDLESA